MDETHTHMMPPVAQGADSKKESVTYRIYEAVLEDIRSGKLAPGSKLKVRDLSSAYTGSVGSCREVMNRLMGERFIETRGMTGFKVRDLCAVDFAEVHALRAALEEHALRTAIKVGDAAWEESIIVAYHRLTRGTDTAGLDIVIRETLHRNFHLALIDAGSSDWHQFYVRVLNLHGERYRRILLPNRIKSASYLEKVDAEHKQLMELCLERKADGAAKLLKKHRSRSRADLLKELRGLEKGN
jgi:DNA-binding GntR family transcriptional regulator